MSCLVGNSRRHVFSCRGSYNALFLNAIMSVRLPNYLVAIFSLFCILEEGRACYFPIHLMVMCSPSHFHKLSRAVKEIRNFLH